MCHSTVFGAVELLSGIATGLVASLVVFLFQWLRQFFRARRFTGSWDHFETKDLPDLDKGNVKSIGGLTRIRMKTFNPWSLLIETDTAENGKDGIRRWRGEYHVVAGGYGTGTYSYDKDEFPPQWGAHELKRVTRAVRNQRVPLIFVTIKDGGSRDFSDGAQVWRRVGA